MHSLVWYSYASLIESLEEKYLVKYLPILQLHISIFSTKNPISAKFHLPLTTTVERYEGEIQNALERHRYTDIALRAFW